jgi:cytochrome c553
MMIRSRCFLGLAGLLAITAAGCVQAPLTGAAHGADLYRNCIPCHGNDGSGNADVGAPSIAGAPQWYVEAQLGKFKHGQRAYHPDDITGLRMRPMTLTLPTDDDVEDVAGYVASLTPVQVKRTFEADAAKGKNLYGLCQACHAAEGTGNEQMKAPPLKHLPDWYLVRQLANFKTGVRGMHPDDQSGALMKAMGSTLTDEQAMKDVVAYIESL